MAERIFRILASAPMFGGLSDPELAGIRKIAVDRFFDRGKTVFAEGEAGEGFYVVADGRVKIFKLSPDGKEHILHICEAGNPFGEAAVFAGKRFPAHAQTLIKSHLLYFSRGQFLGLISENPSLALNMLGVLSRRLREFTLQIENLSLKEVPARLATHLLLIGGAGEKSVTLEISKGQLASLLGTIPETLSRILSRMAACRLIEMDGRTIHLVDRQGLEEIASQQRRLE